MRIKLLTYNIHGWRTTDGRPNLDMIANVIAETGADIVGLNEVFYPRMVANTSAPALEVLAARLKMHLVFGPCLRWPVQNNMPADAYGNALLSRWPIIASAAHHLTPKDEKQQAILVDKEQRGLLEGRILLPNKQTFTIYVTHLDHTSEEARLVQLRELRSWTSRDRNRPHVVMGDFNTLSPWDFADRAAEAAALPSLHPSLAYMAPDAGGPQVVAHMEKAGYTDIFTLFSQPGQGSFIPAAIPTRIDYIFASQPLVAALKSCVIWQEPVGTEASDHRPVLAAIELDR